MPAYDAAHLAEAAIRKDPTRAQPPDDAEARRGRRR